MENNFTSQEHSRDANGNVVMESAGRTIARMRERQRGRNFVNGVVISCLALATVVSGVLLGATSRYANNLRSELNDVQQQYQTMTQQMGSGSNSGTSGMSGTSNYSGTMSNTSGTGTTDSMNNGTGDGTNGSGTTGSSYDNTTNTNYGNGGRWGGYRRNWRNFNNNGISPVNLPTSDYSGTGTSNFGSGFGSGSGLNSTTTSFSYGNGGSSYNS